MCLIHTLRGRIALYVALLVIASLAIGIGAAIGIQQLHGDIGFASRGYRQLRQVYEVGYYAAAARDALRDHRLPAALAAAESAGVRLETSGPDSPMDEAQKKPCTEAMDQLLRALRAGDTTAADVRVNHLLGELADTSAQIRQSVAAYEDAAERHRREAFLRVCIISAFVLIAGMFLGVRLYQSVVRPLDRLAAGVRSFASGRLQNRLPATGDREFAALANDFNAMALELQSLYDNLEQRVRTTSRQLAQSERLASVGYLAAGVAHEINNPLGIIAGYGERSLQLLRRGQLGDDGVRSIDRSIGIICDEAFRCKQITDRLLMLARPGESARTIVSVAKVASDVITSVGGLGRFSDRRIRLTADEQQPLDVFASEGALRQVILNLVINALEAVEPASGEVHVSVGRRNEEVELIVRDNGRGIAADVLPHIFEPFFTQKRGDDRVAGTGLGLSLAHAIVAEAGGRIEARSAGAGCGSEFVVHFPVAVQKEGSYVNAE